MPLNFHDEKKKSSNNIMNKISVLKSQVRLKFMRKKNKMYTLRKFLHEKPWLKCLSIYEADYINKLKECPSFLSVLKLTLIFNV